MEDDSKNEAYEWNNSVLKTYNKNVHTMSLIGNTKSFLLDALPQIISSSVVSLHQYAGFHQAHIQLTYKIPITEKYISLWQCSSCLRYMARSCKEL